MTIQLSEEYNDNIFLIDEDRSVAEELDDFITTVSPRLQLGYVLDRLRTDLHARVDFLQYAEYTELNDEDQFYDMNVDYDFDEYTRLNFSAGYKRDSSRDQDLEESGLLLGNTVREKQTYRFSAAHAATVFSSLNFTYAFVKDDFFESEIDDQRDLLDEEELRKQRQLSDSRLHSASMTYSYDTGRWWTDSSMYITTNYLNYHTERSVQNNVTMVLGLAYTYDDTFSIRLDGGIRYSHEDYDDQRLKLLAAPPFFETLDTERSQEEWGPVGNLTLGYKGESTSIGLSCSFDVQPSSGQGTLTEKTEFRLDVKKRLAEDLRMNFYSSYIINARDGLLEEEPIADAAALAVHNAIPALQALLAEEPEEFGEVDEETFNTGVKMIWEINRSFTLTGSYSYTVFRKNLSESEARRNLVSLRLSYNYSFM